MNIRLIQKGPFASLLARLPVGARGIMMVPKKTDVYCKTDSERSLEQREELHSKERSESLK